MTDSLDERGRTDAPPADRAPAWSVPPADAPLARTDLPPVPGRSLEWSADQRAARRLVLVTLLGAAAASAGLEWQGWQIVARTADLAASGGIPLADFARGAANTFSGALGVGAGASAFAMLFPASWRRPWRAATSAFALGAAGFLAFLAFLTSLAP